MAKPRILFVDDDHHFREGLRLTLRTYQREWDVTFAESVDDALAQARQVVPDVIVSDVNMPRRSGLDLLVELKEDPVLKKLPVIILTGNAELDLKRKALDLGATDLLNKPFQREDLVARVRNAVRLKSYEDQLRDHNQILEDAVEERTRELERSKRGILWRLAKAGEFRDEETGNHVARVACSSQLVAKALGVDDDLVEAIFLTSPLHDIGKIGISDSILLKPGSLTNEEMDVMRTHCMIGAAILLETPSGFGDFGEAFLGADHDKGMEADVLLQTASEICLTHHERWDGDGYPHQLAGDTIPISGRIVAVSDVYDALRSARPYKQAFSIDKALSIIQESRGTHFDPDVCDAFAKVQDEVEDLRLKLVDPSSSADDRVGSTT